MKKFGIIIGIFLSFFLFSSLKTSINADYCDNYTCNSCPCDCQVCNSTSLSCECSTGKEVSTCNDLHVCNWRNNDHTHPECYRYPNKVPIPCDAQPQYKLPNGSWSCPEGNPGEACKGWENGCCKYYTKYDYTTCDKSCYNTTTSTYTGNTCTCCTQIVCTCTPTCPISGTSTTVSGSLCQAGNASCSESNACSNCTTTGSMCYYPETNPTFIQSNGSTNGPATINVLVNGYTYQLSTNPTTPTLIKLPTKNTTDVKVTIPSFTAPATSRGGGYYFQADNYGTTADNWAGGTACTGKVGEDFCIDGGTSGTSNTINFVPSTQAISNVIKEGASGKITGRYYTIDKCDNNKKYSIAVEGYYIVDTEPTVLNCSQTMISNLATDITPAQCTSTTYSGTDIHNPLLFSTNITDANGISDIQGLILWFSKDTLTPATIPMNGSTPVEDVTNDIGIFIRKTGSDWSSRTMYGYDNVSGAWEQTSDGNIRNSNNEVTLKVTVNSVTSNGTTLNFNFNIDLYSTTINPSGMFNVYVRGVDTNMINSNIVDQSRISECFDWGIDLVNPTTSDISLQVQSQTTTQVHWKTDDSIGGSGIGRVIINGAKSGGVTSDIVGLYLPTAYTVNKGNITLGSIDDPDIGKYNNIKGWVFNNVAEETDLLNIGTNNDGKIFLYVTAYDNACNTSGTSTDIDLDSWLASRGGAVYSQNNINTNPKPVATTSALDNVFNTRTRMNKSLVDLGTELLATRNSNIAALINSTTSKAVRGFFLYDANNVKGYWFQQLLNKFEEQRANLTSFTPVAMSVSANCTTGNFCYYYSEGDITIPHSDSTPTTPYVCDKPTLFIAQGNITIEPNVIGGTNPSSGCIFVAGNNIIIQDGAYLSSTSKTRYDYIEGFMIAENQIIFAVADTTRTVKDGIEIFGGMMAFGSNPPSGESAISIQRNLQLFNQTNPTVVVTYDNKYPNMSTKFFGVEAPIYKQEVGFKTF